jgi:hypothetical protein
MDPPSSLPHMASKDFYKVPTPWLNLLIYLAVWNWKFPMVTDHAMLLLFHQRWKRYLLHDKYWHKIDYDNWIDHSHNFQVKLKVSLEKREQEKTRICISENMPKTNLK